MMCKQSLNDNYITSILTRAVVSSFKLLGPMRGKVSINEALPNRIMMKRDLNSDNFLRYKIYCCTVNIIMDVILIQVIDKSYLFGFAHFLLPRFVFRQCFGTCITMEVTLAKYTLMRL